ncbi:hypothetical protein [Sphingomonas sp.]
MTIDRVHRDIGEHIDLGATLTEEVVAESVPHDLAKLTPLLVR